MLIGTLGKVDSFRRKREKGRMESTYNTKYPLHQESQLLSDWNVVLLILLKVYEGANVEETEFEDLSEMPNFGRDIILHFEE